MDVEVLFSEALLCRRAADAATLRRTLLAAAARLTSTASLSRMKPAVEQRSWDALT